MVMDKGQRDNKLELQMTPMIDVVFLLLIFFIVTLRIPAEEAMIETELPKAKGTGEAEAVDETRQEFDDILLHIRQEAGSKSRVTINGQWMPSPAALKGRLDMLKTINPKGRVVIHADETVPYEELITAISVVQMVELPMAFADLK